MNGQLAWYLARAGGMTAWALLSLSVVWGLLLSTRVLAGRPKPAWLLDLHRFLGGLALVFTGVHIGGLVADNYVHFGRADVLVPFASSWKPGAVAWGVTAFYLLVAVELTSLLRNRLSRRVWHGVHLSSYVLFWVAALHGVLAGTDSGNAVFVWASNATMVLVLFLTIYRVLVGRGRGRAVTRRASSAASVPAG